MWEEEVGERGRSERGRSRGWKKKDLKQRGREAFAEESTVCVSMCVCMCKCVCVYVCVGKKEKNERSVLFSPASFPLFLSLSFSRAFPSVAPLKGAPVRVAESLCERRHCGPSRKTGRREGVGAKRSGNCTVVFAPKSDSLLCIVLRAHRGAVGKHCQWQWLAGRRWIGSEGSGTERRPRRASSAVH